MKNTSCLRSNLSVYHILVLLCSACLFSNCKSDKIELEGCKLIEVWERTFDSTEVKLLDITYGPNNRIESINTPYSGAGPMGQTINYIYDSENKIISASAEWANGSKRKTLEYFYQGEQLSEIEQMIMYDSGMETDTIFTNYTMEYNSEGIINQMVEIENGVDFSSWLNIYPLSGARISWPYLTAQGPTNFYFDLNAKGLFEDLSHTEAFAYCMSTDRPFFLFENALHSRKIDLQFPGLAYIDTLSNSTFNDQGFQTQALNTRGIGYWFEYDCE